MSRIAILSDSDFSIPGGVQEHVRSSARLLQAMKHEVRVYTPGTDLSRLEGISNTAGNTLRLNFNFNGNKVRIPVLASVGTLLHDLKDFEPDIIEVQLPANPMFVQRLICNYASPRLVGLLHVAPRRGWHTMASRLASPVLAPTFSRLSEAFAVGPVAATYGRRAFGVEFAPQIPAFQIINDADFPPERRFDVVMLGALVERKGPLDGLRALIAASRKRGAAPLTVAVVGRGPLMRDMRSMAESSPAVDVTFFGLLSDIDRDHVLQESTVAIFPSKGGESFGYALLDALRAGCVLMASDIPGYRFLLAATPHLLLASESPQEWVDPLLLFLTDEARRRTAWLDQRTHVRLAHKQMLKHLHHRITGDAL